jgi:hypothetical protein
MFGVSEVTISKTYKKIEKIKHILNDDKKVLEIFNKMNKQKAKDEPIDPLLLERMKQFNIQVNGEIKNVNGEIKNVNGEIKNVNGEIKNVKEEINIKYIIKKDKKLENIIEEDDDNDDDNDNESIEENIKIVSTSDKTTIKKPTIKNPTIKNPTKIKN